jgi:hypothetical protein
MPFSPNREDSFSNHATIFEVSKFYNSGSSRIPGIGIWVPAALLLASSKQEQSGAKTQASVLPHRTYPGIPVQLWYYGTKSQHKTRNNGTLKTVQNSKMK